MADQQSTVASPAARPPVIRQINLVTRLNTRHDATPTGAEIIAKPSECQIDVLDKRQLRLKLVQCADYIHLACRCMLVERCFPTWIFNPPHKFWRVHKFAACRNEVYRANNAFQPLRTAAHRTRHLEGQLRQTCAEFIQREVFKHHIGKPAIGRCVALSCDNQRVCELVRTAAIQTGGDMRE